MIIWLRLNPRLSRTTSIRQDQGHRPVSRLGWRGPKTLLPADGSRHSGRMTLTRRTTDHELRIAIIDELTWAANVDADRIGVAIYNDAVTLSGQVGSFPEKEAAVHATLRVRGVTAVADEIVVHHHRGTRTDADIAREAAAALDRTVVLPPGSVKATVHDHVITLSGSVAWHYQREATRHAVSVLPGVVGVRSTVTLKPPTVISAADATSKITAALLRNAQADARHIQVAVFGSEIRLTGTAASWAERHQAEYAAWSTPGVTHVDNRVTIRS